MNTPYDHTDDAVAFLAAIMRSASTDQISPKQWYPRATSALVTAAACATDYPAMVTEMTRKLGIEVLGAESSEKVVKLRDNISDFEGFRAFCEADATWIVASWRATKPTRPAKPAPTQPVTTQPAPTDQEIPF